MAIKRRKGSKRARQLFASMQELETRRLLSADWIAHPTFVINASSTLSPPFTPSQIRQAYNINSISANGAGQTIAIVDAFNDPNIVGDVHAFNSMFSLQQFNVAGGPMFTVENQTGAATPLPPNASPGGWDVEESLDVEWAHSLAPEANIILLDANSANNNDLYNTVNVARNIPGVSIVEMSWGGPEDPSDTSEDALFTTPAGHQGITFISSTGDSGEPGGYPAYSPNILAVGGTSLTINSNGSYGGESAWSEGGGGISRFEAQPDYQTAKVSAFSYTQRTEPDVSWLADPNTGVSIVDTYSGSSSNGLIQIGGTSLATPMWGALISMINQGRAAEGFPTLDGPSQTLPMLYDLPSDAFKDITTGNNGFAAGPGYDLATGLGTPNVPTLYSDMLAVNTIYVDAGAPGVTQNGTSWTDAYTTLSQALSAATGNDEILVSQGTYYPTASDDPTATFQLQDNVAIYGGYAGYGTSNPNAQSATLYPTTLSGAIGDAGPFLDYSQHIVTASDTNSTAILDGVTITQNTTSDETTLGEGSALYNIGGSPTLTNCLIADSSSNGGAVYNSGGSDEFINCTFNDNDGGAGLGGAIDDESSAILLIHCTFTDNSAFYGGALYEFESNSTITDCMFTQNVAIYDGGGIETDSNTHIVDTIFENNSSPNGGAIGCDSAQLINCLLVGNSGEGVINEEGLSVILTNCTIAGNAAPAMEVQEGGSPVVTNCIIWDNTYPIIVYDGSATVTYSDIQGGYMGTGNIDADPQFVRAPGTNGPTDPGDLHLQLSSPAIDDGNNSALPSNITTDLDGRPRFVNIAGVNDPGAIVDMGAYEAFPDVIFVDAIATGKNTGASWTDAFTSLSSALATALAGETIEVAQGTYNPTLSYDRTSTFQLINNVTIEGGFAGVGTTDPDARDATIHPTILSGDIGAPGNAADNSYHVVTASNTNFTATLDGFTITDGNADANPNNDIGDAIGGGLYSYNGDATINDCVFTRNTAILFGGGIFEQANSALTISDCTFTDNIAGNGPYNAFGGAIGNFAANPLIFNCTFTGNAAISAANQAIGGAIEDEFSTPTIINCTFTQNLVSGGNGGFGGAIDNQEDSSPEIDNSTFNGNTASEAGGAVMNITVVPLFNDDVFAGNAAPLGGAMYNFTSANPTLINCTFSFNLAEIGGAIVNDTSSIPVITNSILWGDEALDSGNEIYLATTNSSATVTHSDIDGGFAGAGNINTDPLFLRNPDPGTDEQWGTADDYYGNLALSANSPAIDIGSNSAVRSGITTDVANEPRLVDIPGIHDPGAIVDLGAYERQLVNALSFSFTAPQQLTIQFSTEVSASLTASDLQIIPTLGGSPITATTLYYDASTNTATFSFASPLNAGIYQAMLNNSAITDVFGNALASTYQFSFLYVPDSQSLGLPGGGQVYTVQQFSIGAGATLDIGNDELIVQYNVASPAATIQSLLTTGFNDGTWNGTGIISSDTSLGTAAGYYDDGSQVTVRRTWTGDTNLDGVVNADDLSLMMLGQILGQTSWQWGNFNYDTQINADDWIELMAGAAVSQGQSINAFIINQSPFATFANDATPAAKVADLIHASDTSINPVLEDFSSILEG